MSQGWSTSTGELLTARKLKKGEPLPPNEIGALRKRLLALGEPSNHSASITKVFHQVSVFLANGNAPDADKLLTQLEKMLVKAPVPPIETGTSTSQSQVEDPVAKQQAEKERLAREQERMEKERLEQERLRLEQERLRLEQERLEKERIEREAQAIRTDSAMTVDPVGANEADLLSAGVADARQAVLDALKGDPLKDSDLVSARKLLETVKLAVAKAEASAKEKDRLELLAEAVRKNEAMTKIPKDANTTEIKDAGLELAREAVTNALKTRDDRIESDVNAASNLLPNVVTAIDKAEKAAAARLLFAVEKDKAEKARLALPSYTAATLIAATPPTELAKEVKAFKAKEKVVTEAETAGLWPKAQNGLGALEVAAKALVDTHALWDLYDKAYTAEIKKNVVDADNIVLANPAPLADEIKAFNKKRAFWQMAVTLPSWAGAKTHIVGLAPLAKTLVDTHALWDAYNKLATVQFNKDVKAAAKVWNEKSPDLTAENDDFLSKWQDWDSALKGKNWKDAADAVPDLQQSSTDLLAAKQLLMDAFNVAYSGQVKTDIDKAEAVYKKKLAGLTLATRVFAPVFDPFDQDYADAKWVAAKNAVPAVHNAAKAYLLAKKQHDTEELAFDNTMSGVANYNEAVAICWGNPKPSTDTSPAEVRAFRQADLIMRDAKKIGDWVAAKAALPALKNTIPPLIPAFNDWKTYGLRAQALAPLIEKARLAGADAPAKLTAEKAAFELEANKIGPAATGKNWSAALISVNATEPLAKALLDARVLYDKERKPFDDAVKLATPKAEEARAIIKSLPTALQTNQKVVDFTAAETAVSDARRDEKWTDGVGAANSLKLKAEAVIGESATFNTSFSDEDVKEIPKKLKALEPRTKKAEDAPPLSTYVDTLQKAVVTQLGVVNARVIAKDYLDAAAKYDALVVAVEKMEAAKTAHEQFKVKYTNAEIGPVKEARELGDDPAALALVRNSALDKVKKRIENAAKIGQISLATGLVNTWVEEAKGWKDRWAEAKEAHTALTTPPPDEAKLQQLADAPGGGKVFDDLVASLPEDTTNSDVIAKAMQVRYGVDIKQFKTQQKNVYDLEAVPTTAPDKSVKKLYKLLATVPDTHVKGALKEIVRYTEDSGGGDYGALMKKMNLYCGRSDDGSKEKLIEVDELPEVDEDCKPVDNVNPKQFGWTALHEVAHGIDDAANFMGSRRGSAKFGGWLSSSPEDAAAAAADEFGCDKDYLVKVLNNKGAAIPAERPVPLTGDPTALANQTKAEQWCAKIVEGYELWWKGAECEAVAIGGRVYQQAYASDWFSYPVAARKQGITGYSFRSPAEWFAELYAAYYTKKLKEVHPAVSWLKDLKNAEA